MHHYRQHKALGSEHGICGFCGEPLNRGEWWETHTCGHSAHGLCRRKYPQVEACGICLDEHIAQCDRGDAR